VSYNNQECYVVKVVSSVESDLDISNLELQAEQIVSSTTSAFNGNKSCNSVDLSEKNNKFTKSGFYLLPINVAGLNEYTEASFLLNLNEDLFHSE
jgi:hypothetical protein